MKFLKQPIKLVIVCLFSLLLAAFSNKNLDDKNYNVKLQIINHEGDRINNFLVKIAKNIEDKERGLMWVETLPKNYGMIFEFEGEQLINMWMKNTKIPLDIIFINNQGVIINIARNTTPESLAIISSKKPASKVLEINGGLSEFLGISIGDVVKY